MKISITGFGGSIGSELTRQLCVGHKIFGLDNNETAVCDLTEELQQKGHWVYGRVGDIRDMETVRDVFSDFKPDAVIHAAALKHVKPNENYPIEAIKTNVIGTYNVLQQAKNFNVKKFIFISSDKATNPHSVMGQTKRLGETMVRNAGYTAVRFGNVMGSRGSVLPLWESQVKRGEPITITDEKMERYFMTIPEACALVVEAMNQAIPGKTIVLDMGARIRVIDLANTLYPNHKKIIIGVRPGETLIEELMTEEEKKTAKISDKFWIL